MARVRLWISGLSTRGHSSNWLSRPFNASSLSVTKVLVATTFIGASAYTSQRPATQTAITDAVVFKIDGEIGDSALTSQSTSEIQYEVNGVLKTHEFQGGAFSIPVELEVGENTVEVFGLGLSDPSRWEIQRLQHPGPVTFAAPPAQVVGEMVELSGEVVMSDQVKELTMSSFELVVNDERQMVLLQDGHFKTQIALDPGENVIKVSKSPQLLVGAEPISIKRDTGKVNALVLHHDFQSSDHDWKLVTTDSGRSAHDPEIGSLRFDDSHIVLGELDLVFVIDTSGSMVGTPLENARQEVAKITASITTTMPWGIRVGLVAAATSSGSQDMQVFALESEVNAQMDLVSKQLKTDGGGNDQLRGIEKALELLEKSANTTTKVIVLVTDAGFGDAGKQLNGRIKQQLEQQFEYIRNQCDKQNVYLSIVLDQTDRDQEKIEKRERDARKLVKKDRDVRKYDKGIENLVSVINEQILRARELGRLGVWDAPVSIINTLNQCQVGDRLSFRVQQPKFTSAPEKTPEKYTSDFIRLVGEAGEIFSGVSPEHLSDGKWFKVERALSATSNWTCRETQQPATDDKILAVLRSLKSVLIRCDYRLGPENTLLDDFRIHRTLPLSTTK